MKREEIKARKANERLFNKKVDGFVKKPEFNPTVPFRDEFDQVSALEKGPWLNPW